MSAHTKTRHIEEKQCEVIVKMPGRKSAHS